MKYYAVLYTFLATASISGGAFAQDNPSGSNKGLNAGDNVQSAPTHKSTPSKNMKSSRSGAAGQSTQPGGTTTPSGPGAPVSASGSGS